MPGSAGSNFGLTYGYTVGEAWDFEADFRRMDILLALSVESAVLTSPPVSPAAGNRYIIAATASGAWAGKEDQVARYNGAAWEYQEPPEGLLAYDTNGLQILRYTGSAWESPVLRKIRTDLHNSTPYNNDAEAAAGGVQLGELYSNFGAIMVRST